MMKVRGYDIEPLSRFLEYTPEMFGSVFADWSRKYVSHSSDTQSILIKHHKKTSARSMMSYTLKHLENENDTCVVYFAEIGTGKSVPISEVAVLGTILYHLKSFSGIIVSTTKLSPQTATRLSEIDATGLMFIQHFIDEDLSYDPTNCVWGSKARILSPEEADTFLADNKIKASQMPRIAIEGPVAKYLGVRPGQIMEFERQSFLPGTLLDEEIFHRYAYRRPPEKNKKR